MPSPPDATTGPLILVTPGLIGHPHRGNLCLRPQPRWPDRQSAPITRPLAHSA